MSEAKIGDHGSTMIETVDLSIIIINWNSCAFLRDCLESIMHNAPNFPYEVIVIDNASFDGSAEMVQQISDTFPVLLRLIKNVSNRGFCAANNQGISESRAEFIALLNNDAEAEPRWLAALEDVLTQDGYRRIEKLGRQFADGLDTLFRRHGLDWRAFRLGRNATVTVA